VKQLGILNWVPFLMLKFAGIAQKSMKRKACMKKDLLHYNLQFFAEGEGEGAEVTEPAAPSEDTAPEGADETADAEEPEAEVEGEEGEIEEPAAPQSPEENAKYAAARREAEAQARQYQEAQQQIDSQFAQMFGKYKNPVTGQPIRSAAEYLAAMQAQERRQMQEKLKSAGVDPEALDKAIANSPVVQQAQRMQAQFQQQQVQQMVQEDFREILKFDSTKSNEQDIINDPAYGQALSYVQSHPGVRLSEAYKMVTYDRARTNSQAAAQQAAINQVKSKSHLKSVTGSAGNDKDVDIPAADLSRWQQMFPEKSAKELKATYNRSLRAHGK
jgi:hypothetical protein